MIVVMHKLLFSLVLAIMSFFGSFSTSIHAGTPYSEQDFEKAVQMIKKYETLHSARHWPLVGYGHKVQPGENFKKGVALTEAQADKLLRKDLKKMIDCFKEYGKDSLLLGLLAYNVDPGRVNKSEIVRMLKNGNRNIKNAFLGMCRYKGREHKQIKSRRIEEYSNFFHT